MLGRPEPKGTLAHRSKVGRPDQPASQEGIEPVRVGPFRRRSPRWTDVLDTFATRLAQGRIYRRELATVEPAGRRLVEV